MRHLCAEVHNGLAGYVTRFLASDFSVAKQHDTIGSVSIERGVPDGAGQPVRRGLVQ